MISENSQKYYENTYNMLIKKSGSENIEDIINFIKNSDVKISTKRNYLNSIISLNKYGKINIDNIDFIKTYRDGISDVINKKIQHGENLNENQKSAMEELKQEDVFELVEELNKNKNKSDKHFNDYIFIALILETHLRNDIGNLEIINDKKKVKPTRNYIYVTRNNPVELIINEYKTSRTYEPIIITLSEDLGNDIKAYLRLYKNKDYLFSNRKGNPLSSSEMTHRINNIFKRKFNNNISTTILRKFYLTNKYKDVINEMEQDAKNMGHSTDTQKTYYINNKI
jgi:integrase